MGEAAPSGSERAGGDGTGVRKTKVFAQNTGKCVEDPVGDGETCLHLGSGRHNWPGWVNVDQDPRADVQADIRHLGNPDNSVDRIVAVHVFEHFYRWDVPAVLAEWKRVLKPGGKLTLELPCMDKVFAYLAARIKSGEPSAPSFSCFALWGDPSYQSPAMCHKWGYFKADMVNVLTEAGFATVQHEEARYHFPQRDMRVTATKGA